MHTPTTLWPRFRLVWIVLPVLAVLLLGMVRARDDDVEDAKFRSDAAKARPGVLDVAGDLADGADAAKMEKARARAKEVRKLHPLDAVMWQLKLRDKGGLGVGATPGLLVPDGIEAKLIVLGGLRRPLTANQLKAEQADLQRMGEITRAVAVIARCYRPEVSGRGWVGLWSLICAVVWDVLSEDAEKNAQDFLDAVKSGDPKATQRASYYLSNSCTNCHSWCRDR